MESSHALVALANVLLETLRSGQNISCCGCDSCNGRSLAILLFHLLPVIALSPKCA